MRDQNGLLFRFRHRQRSGPTHQSLKDTLAHLHDIVLALAQIGVLDLLELFDQDAHLLRQRPFGVAMLLGDDLLRRFGERRIVQDHPVDVEKCAKLARHVAGRHRAVQRFELALDFLDGQLETLDLRGDLLGGNRVMRDLERRVGHELSAPDRDAARNADAV